MSRKNITEVVIGVLAILSIVLVVIEAVVPISRGVKLCIFVADFVICIVFAVDFIQRLRASERKSHFMKTNGYEILAMIPAVALYAVGTISAVTAAFRFLRLIRLVIVLARMRRLVSKTGGFFQKSRLLLLFGITVVVIFVGAFTVYLLDIGSANARITNFSDAVWWSISTVTTVGYGDVVPGSFAGRIMGMVLMVVGIGVMAAFISQVSATLVESRLKSNSKVDDFKSNVISEIKNKLDNLDKLNESEVSLLIKTIQMLRSEKGQASVPEIK